MNVLALTIFVGSILVLLFTLLWFLQAICPHSLSEREALLPLDEDSPSASPEDTSAL